MTGATLTTTAAAALAGLSTASFRKEMQRQRTKGNDFRRPGPDARTPLWDRVSVEAWAVSRRGWATHHQPTDN